MMTTKWKSCELGSVVALQRGYDLPSRLRKPGDVPIVTSSGIGNTHDKAMVEGPGVVTGRYGTIGEVFFISEDFWPLNTTLFVRDFRGNDPSFVAHFLRTIDFQVHSGKSGVPGVNRNDLHGVVVCIPESVEEQRKIAAALNDVDSLLGALDQLIVKKRDLKQAAMQQLLSGRSRLPGFSGGWDEVSLGETLLKIGSGITPAGGSSVYTHSGRPFLRSQNVGWGRLILDDVVFISDDIHSFFSGTEIRIRDVFLNITGASIGRSGIADLRVVGGNVNQHVCIIRPVPTLLDSGYLNCFLLSEFGQRQIDSFQAGGEPAGSQPESNPIIHRPAPFAC